MHLGPYWNCSLLSVLRKKNKLVITDRNVTVPFSYVLHTYCKPSLYVGKPLLSDLCQAQPAQP